MRRLLPHSRRHRHEQARSGPAYLSRRVGKREHSVTGEDNDPIISRYSQLARAAIGGEAIRDCDPDAFEDGCFGAAAYPDRSLAPEAAFEVSLGCGNPLMVADLQPGEIVLDLGSGGGLDVLLSARRVAPDGIAYGLDASNDMLTLARANTDTAKITNARFLYGHIESIPLPDDHVDVIISNCVINLSGDKTPRLGRGIPRAQARRTAWHQRRHRRRRHRPGAARPRRTAGRLRRRRVDPASIRTAPGDSGIRGRHHHQHQPGSRRSARGDH